MKRLSDFKDEQGVIVIAKLLQPLTRILQNASKLRDKENPLALISSMLEVCPRDTMEIFAILSETPIDDYHCNGASLLADTITLASDPEFVSLFGFQSQTQTSSGSVSETTEVR